jgi:hypothetical protein
MTKFSFCTSVFGLVVAWSALALAQSHNIEPVEAKTMAKSGAANAAKNGAVKMTQAQDSKQLRVAQSGSQGSAAGVVNSANGGGHNGQGTQTRAQKGDAKQQRLHQGAASGDAKHKGMQGTTAKQGGSSALRDATRSQDRMRTRDPSSDHTGSADRGGNAQRGEHCNADSAEHRQERRGGGAGAGAHGGTGTQGSGNGAGAGRN